MRKLYLLIAITGLFGACAKGPLTKNGPAAPGNSPTQASGTINGGGGVGIRCGNHLEMLDLYEARQAGLTLVNPPQSEDEAVKLVSQRIARHFWNPDTIPEDQQAATIAKDMIAPIFESRPLFNAETNRSEDVRFVDKLPLSNDFGNYSLPAGCHLEQIAFYSDAKTHLSIVKTAWAQLDWLSKSVLAAHEVNYLMDRRDGFENLKPGKVQHTSQLTRKFVGQLFSAESLTPRGDGVPLHGISCMKVPADDPHMTYFYAFNDAKTQKLSIVINVMLGGSSLYQTRADFKDATVAALVDTANGAFTEDASVQMVGSRDAPEFAIKIVKSKGAAPKFQLYYMPTNAQPDLVGGQGLKCSSYSR